LYPKEEALGEIIILLGETIILLDPYINDGFIIPELNPP